MLHCSQPTATSRRARREVEYLGVSENLGPGLLSCKFKDRDKSRSQLKWAVGEIPSYAGLLTHSGLSKPSSCRRLSVCIAQPTSL